MDNFFIVPMNPVSFQNDLDLSKNEKILGSSGTDMFRDIFQSMISDAAAADTEYEKQKYLLATGQIEDAHSVTIAGSYAQLAVDMLVSLRNKAMESYNELMRMNV